ncbi:MAG: hypothetical protein ACXVA9_02215 [Bdellovibrionales bacterium]
MSNWTKNFAPRAGGWSRLSVKLNEAEISRRQEIRLWGAVATLLILVTAFSALKGIGYRDDQRFQIEPLAPGEVKVANGSAVEIPGTPEGVRYFWVVK